jgi:PAS domain S-box-containing protein
MTNENGALDELRRRALERLKATRTDVSRMSDAEVQDFIYELQVHQEELEIANEDLRGAQLELARAHYRYMDLFESAPMGYLTLDRRQVIRQVNATAASMLGLSRFDLVGSALTRFAVPEDRDACYIYLRGIQRGASGMADVRFQRSDGSVFWAQVQGRWMETGDVGGGGSEAQTMRVAFSDITERVRAEEALRASERRYRFLFEESQSLVVVVGIDGTLRDVNRYGLRLTGYAKEEVVGRSPVELVKPDQRAFVYERLRTVMAGEPAESFDVTIIAKDGSERLLVTSPGSEVLREDGKPVEIILSAADITRRKWLEDNLRSRAEELEIANRELEAFSYSVSHDLRAPLSQIKAAAELLRYGHSERLDEEGVEAIRLVRKGVDKMGILIRDILAFSQVSREQLSIRHVDLTSLAESVVAELRTSDPEREYHVVLEEGLEADADPRLIRIALTNLIGNAWKYTRTTPHARIEVGAEPHDGREMFFVRDNGVGFDMQYAERLWVPFKRLPPDSTFSGTGIGLPIVQRVIAKHGGTICGEGEKGKGATFWFWLPEVRREGEYGA